MTRVFELVLEIPSAAAREWCAGRASADGADGDADGDIAAAQTDALLVKALAALPGIAGRRRSVAHIAVRDFDAKRALGDAGWRLAVEASGAGRRVIAVHGEAHSPGITIRNAAFQAPLDAQELHEVSFDRAPEAFRKVLPDPSRIEPTVSFECSRTRWRPLSTEAGLPVDVVFERIDVLDSSGFDGAPPVREIHLTVPVADIADVSDVHDAAEAPHAARRALFAIAREIVAALPAFAVLDSAVDRAFRDNFQTQLEPVYAQPIDLAGTATQRDALIAIGGNLARHWFGNEASVRDAANVESVHQMRVAQRRLKTAMRLFRHWQDDAWTMQIAPGLKWLGDLLGDARDWDVFIDSTLPALVAADTDAARWSGTFDAANVQRLAMRARIQDGMHSSRYAQLTLAWLEWQGELLHDDRRAAAGDVAADSLNTHAGKRVRKAFKQLMATPKLTTLDDASRHQERIRAKRLRYTLEFIESLTTKQTRGEVVKTLSRMQGVLGDGNDAVVALGYLEQLEVDAYQLGFARGWCEAVKRYTAKEGERLLRTLGKPKLRDGR
ncbi:CHAD domain-containing protein [Paraburkholderia megapolitana]|uniref:CHAD domain-containing protein n=1 Tax=Paraburkholderia megapolitana TaxID=420953 RepID=A0A1I3LRH0_9BURK|nr:CHAD domain-containing protein [Paraburkholderia megapolitana]QDQ80825.1 CHAD domain-containing protein [Paraburkholderia megapolitana]SFI87369.1 CHAD domain-containing protein [Paraburkholderia megapolitana]